MSAFFGCAKVGPDYSPPAYPVPDEWRSPATGAYAFDRPDRLAWWDVFGDPVLNDLMIRAKDSNLDLKAAVARVKQARAQIGVARGELLPSASADASAATLRTSENSGGLGGDSNSFSGSLGANWEIDLFGKISRSIEAYTADYEASLEDRAGVMVALYAQLADAYIQVRTDQARIKSVEENIRSQEEMLAITQSRFRNGLASGLDVYQAKSVLASSRAQIPLLKNDLNQAANSVALILALEPGALKELLDRPMPIPSPPLKVAVGVPADILRQRPDIRQAERNLAAATARIGQATADLYPSFTLSGELGLSSAEAGDFLKAGSRFYTLGPSLSWNIFTGGRVKSQIKVQDALAEQALVGYTQTVLGALHEVDNALTDFYRRGQKVEAQQLTALYSFKTLELAVKLYKEGLQDFQSVLDAQRSLFDATDTLAQARGDHASSLVNLYQALGGGWRPNGEPGADEAGAAARSGPAPGENPSGT